MQSKNNQTVDLETLIQKLITYKDISNQTFPLKEQEVYSLSHLFRKQLIQQPMLLELNPPIAICGDIHGQFKDLLKMFVAGGDPSHTNYLFLGDYVDRGKKSLQCICLLMAYKVKYSKTFFLLRGNHECQKLNKIYGFYDQCKRKLNIKVWKSIVDSFKYLPIAAVVARRIFCVHGGLSPLLHQINTLNNIKRPIDNDSNSIITDLLWSDPNAISPGWETNFERGVSFTFGRDVLDGFLKKYQFDLICRSHQVVEQGYQFFNQQKLLTIFSAPNYCAEFLNLGAILTVTQQLLCNIQQVKGQDYAIIRNCRRYSTPNKSKIQQMKNRQGQVPIQRQKQNFNEQLSLKEQKGKQKLAIKVKI